MEVVMKKTIVISICVLVFFVNAVQGTPSFNLPDIFKGCTVKYKLTEKTIQETIDEISDANEQNPYVIVIPAGTYNEQVTLKDNVSLCGFDKDICKIESGITEEWLENGDPTNPVRHSGCVEKALKF